MEIDRDREPEREGERELKSSQELWLTGNLESKKKMENLQQKLFARF